MKNLKLCLTSLLFAISHSLFGQEASVYFKAFSYIQKHNREAHLVVSDTIIHLDFSNFNEQIAKLRNQSARKTVAILDSIDQARENKKFAMKELADLRVHKNGPVQIVYFSDLYDNMLIGEVLEQKSGSRSHSSQASFTQVKEYLFIFDKKFVLKKIFTAQIAYD